MIEYNIPGYGHIRAEYLVLDYNGTIAVDGILIPGVKEMLNRIAENLEIHVVTADTFGIARQQLDGINCRIAVLGPLEQNMGKRDYVESLGTEKVIAVGNGRNDALMLRGAAVGIAVVQSEGASFPAMQNADIVCLSVMDAFETILSPLRMTATLRS